MELGVDCMTGARFTGGECIMSGIALNISVSKVAISRASFPWRSGGRSVKLTSHLHLVPRLRMCGAIPPLP
jgi:hypothetical protein